MDQAERDKLRRRLQASAELARRGATPGERQAAEEAVKRIKARLGEDEPRLGAAFGNRTLADVLEEIRREQEAAARRYGFTATTQRPQPAPPFPSGGVYVFNFETRRPRRERHFATGRTYEDELRRTAAEHGVSMADAEDLGLL